ncbi:Ribosomal-protein-alanine acetyltransferase [Mycena kentingensis (nom. inval.)]|nr:Ribosomal-protein-alanine acetyltransferase [Mycena kentingensis (nom. inval.)]
MVSPAVEALRHELYELLADARTTNYLAVAGLTVLIIEHIANFQDEVNLIWKTRMSVSNVFYVWIRYFTLLVLCAEVSCTIALDTVRGISLTNYASVMLRPQYSDHAAMVTSTLITVSADLILVLRVWILYRKSRTMLYFLFPLIAAELAAMIIVGFHTIQPLERYLHVGPILPGCYSLKVPRLFTFYAVPPFITAFIMFCMTLHKCGNTLAALGLGQTPVIAMFLRDGVFWFFSVVLLAVTEIVLWSSARPTLAQIPVVPATALIAVIGARVVLNIKYVALPTSVNLEDGESTDHATADLDSEFEHLPPGRNRRGAGSTPWYLKTM